MEVAPWTAAPAFQPAVQRWAWAEAACQRYRAWFAEHGLHTDDGADRPGTERWQRFEATAAKAADALGLSPQSMAKLLGSLASTAVATGDDGALEALRREGAAILERRALSVVPDPEDAA